MVRNSAQLGEGLPRLTVSQATNPGKKKTLDIFERNRYRANRQYHMLNFSFNEAEVQQLPVLPRLGELRTIEREDRLLERVYHDF
jgi:hypothetical protein